MRRRTGAGRDGHGDGHPDPRFHAHTDSDRDPDADARRRGPARAESAGAHADAQRRAEAPAQGPAQDLGSTPGARGTTTASGGGALLTYTVAEGDSFFDIAQRFNVPVQMMLKMNPSVRGLGESIYIKQIINLDWKAQR